MLKREPFLSNFSSSLKLISLIVIIIICLFIFNILGIVIAMPIWGSNALSTTNINFLKYLQIVNEIGLFIAPVLIFAYLVNKDIKRYLKIGHKPKMFALFASFLLMFVSIPLISWLSSVNQAMHLPVWLNSVEKWMRDMQTSNDALSDSFLKDATKKGLLINMIMIAILPAIGEELLFRGALIKIFKRWFNNVHIAVVVSSIIFSAIHFQFFGFIPRLVLGVILGYLFVYSRNLWVPIFAHFVNNAFAVIIIFLNTKKIINIDPDNLGNTNNDAVAIIGSLVFVLLLMFALYKSRRKIKPHHSTRSYPEQEIPEVEENTIEEDLLNQDLPNLH